jgi:hypothetical protein
MKTLSRIAFSGLFLAALSFQSHANLITNGSFEEGNNLGNSGWGVYQVLDDSDSSTSDWIRIEGAGIEIQAGGTGGLTAQDGIYKVELDSDRNNGGLSGVSTNSVMAQLVEGLLVGNTYELNFWYSARTVGNPNTNQVTAFAGSPNLFVSPGALGTVSSSIKGWEEYSYTFVATNNSMLVGFGAEGNADTLGGFIDNVSLTSVPEPVSVALLGMSLLGFRASRKHVGKL